MTNTNKVTDINVGRMREANDLHKRTVKDAIKIGELLSQVLESIPYGQAGAYLEANWEASPATAYRYIDAYKGSTNFSHGEKSEPKTIKEAASRAPKKTATTTIIGRATGKAIGGSQKRKLKEAGIDIDAHIDADSAEAEEVAAKGAAILNTTVVAREDLPLTIQQKYDKALAKGLAEQKATQEKAYWDDVNAKVVSLMDERTRKVYEENKIVQRDINQLRMGPAAKIMTLEEYRKVLSVLHPDKHPTDAERGEAFTIIRRLDTYVQAANRK